MNNKIMSILAILGSVPLLYSNSFVFNELKSLIKMGVFISDDAIKMEWKAKKLTTEEAKELKQYREGLASGKIKRNRLLESSSEINQQAIAPWQYKLPEEETIPYY